MRIKFCSYWPPFFFFFFLVQPIYPTAANSDNANSDSAVNHSEVTAFEQTLHGLASGFVPPEEDAPRKTTTAGSRNEGQCHGDNSIMRALMPSGNYGLTLEARPALFFEIPQTQAQSVLLAFQSESGEAYSEAILPIAYFNDQGIVRFQPPEEMAGLPLGENIQWTISVLCHGHLDPNNPLFSGWVQRTQPPAELAHTLAHAPISEQIHQLKELGYWYDMLPLHLSYPN